LSEHWDPGDALGGTQIRYLASVFVDAERILPTPDDIKRLVDILGDPNMRAVWGQDPNNPNSPPRLGFSNQSTGRQLALLGNRFDYAAVSSEPEGSDLGSLADFCREAASRLSGAMEHFSQVANRLASVQEGYLPTSSAMPMDNVARNLLHFPDFYAANIPREWDWRANAQTMRMFGESNELCNNISTIRRMVGQYFRMDTHGVFSGEIDKIRIDIDINTHPNNAAPRFRTQEVTAFFAAAGEWHGELSSQLQSFIRRNTT